MIYVDEVFILCCNLNLGCGFFLVLRRKFGSFCCFCNRVNGIEFEEVQMNLAKRQQLSPEFKSKYLYEVYIELGLIVGAEN